MSQAEERRKPSGLPFNPDAIGPMHPAKRCLDPQKLGPKTEEHPPTYIHTSKFLNPSPLNFIATPSEQAGRGNLAPTPAADTGGRERGGEGRKPWVRLCAPVSEIGAEVTFLPRLTTPTQTGQRTSLLTHLEADGESASPISPPSERRDWRFWRGEAICGEKRGWRLAR